MSTCIMKTVDKNLYADGYKLIVGLLVSEKPDFCVVLGRSPLLPFHPINAQISQIISNQYQPNMPDISQSPFGHRYQGFQSPFLREEPVAETHVTSISLVVPTL